MALALSWMTHVKPLLVKTQHFLMNCLLLNSLTSKRQERRRRWCDQTLHLFSSPPVLCDGDTLTGKRFKAASIGPLLCRHIQTGPHHTEQILMAVHARLYLQHANERQGDRHISTANERCTAAASNIIHARFFVSCM